MGDIKQQKYLRGMMQMNFGICIKKFLKNRDWSVLFRTICGLDCIVPVNNTIVERFYMQRIWMVTFQVCFSSCGMNNQCITC